MFCSYYYSTEQQYSHTYLGYSKLCHCFTSEMSDLHGPQLWKLQAPTVLPENLNQLHMHENV